MLDKERETQDLAALALHGATVKAPTLHSIEETLALLLDVDPAELSPELQAELELQIRETVLARGEKLDRIAGRLLQLSMRAESKTAAAKIMEERAAAIKAEARRATADADRLKDYVLSAMRTLPKPKKGALRIEGETSTFTAKGVPSSVEVYDEGQLPLALRVITIELTVEEYGRATAFYMKNPDLDLKPLFCNASWPKSAPKAVIKAALEAMVDCNCANGKESTGAIIDGSGQAMPCPACNGTKKVRATVPGARLIEGKLRLEVS